LLVVDTSAVVAALLGDCPDLEARLAGDGDQHAPHLVDVEFLHVLRWLCGRGALTDHQAEQALRNFARLAIRRYSHVPLTGRIWELRAHLTAYDAAFVALAEILDVPLLTMDRKLARAHGPRVTIECFA